jgi:hypothetical protein
LEAGGKGIDMQDSIEPNHETVVPISDSSTVYDKTSLDQLQEFIDASYQNTLAYELSLAPSISTVQPLLSHNLSNLRPLTLYKNSSIYLKKISSPK